MRKALSVASEVAPLIKTGGLADVAGALPEAMAMEGWELRTLLPGYPAVLDSVGRGRVVLKDDTLFGGPAQVRSVNAGGMKLYVLEASHLFERDGGPYADASGRDWSDNPMRFAAVCWIAARLGVSGIGKWKPEVIHSHDWQAGFTPVCLSQLDGPSPGTILTIHNVAFHGLAPAEDRTVLGLPEGGFNQDGYEFWGRVSALKAGIVWSDKITTVSPSYARELMTPEFGAGLDGLLQTRARDVSGILNGIDLEVWNPATDPAIPNYKSPGGKRRATAALREEMGLPQSEGPLFVVVSRLSDQKGLDLLLESLPVLDETEAQLVLLGSGDAGLERSYREAAHNRPNVAVRIGYDEDLAHRMIAGGDAILVPSRFEPCGLTQLYGLRYGTIPVVAYTGGLIDTVVPATPMCLRSGVANGIQFHPVNAGSLATALSETARLFRDKVAWKALQKNAMQAPVGWDASAREYAALYEAVARR